MAKTTPYVRGTMDIREHKKTLESFWWWTQWTTVAILLLLAFLAWMFT